jgi:hypothetical protein
MNQRRAGRSMTVLKTIIVRALGYFFVTYFLWAIVYNVRNPIRLLLIECFGSPESMRWIKLICSLFLAEGASQRP